MIISIIGAFFATYFFSIIFNISKNHLIYCGSVGAVGWLFYLLGLHYSDSIVLGNFAGALSVAIISHILAKIKKTPVTVFLISGLLPLVPGAGMYRTVYNIIIQDYNNAIFFLMQTLQIAGVIAMAIFLIDSIFRIIRDRQQRIR